MKEGPGKPELIKKILNELKNHPKGIWIRKLARVLNEPVMTIHKYINREDYAGRFVKTELRSHELGGHLIIKLKRKVKK